MRPVVWILIVMISLASLPARATSTFCAVTEKAPDGFVNLRNGPGQSYAAVGKVAHADFLWVATEGCRDDFGKSLCSKGGAWVFVEKVFQFRGPLKGNKLKGWANGQLVRQIQCPDD